MQDQYNNNSHLTKLFNTIKTRIYIHLFYSLTYYRDLDNISKFYEILIYREAIWNYYMIFFPFM